MRKLLQINVVSNLLSTGKIAEDIAKVAIAHGWKSYIAYGRDSKPGVSEEIKVGTQLDVYEHYAWNKLFDREGWASKAATRKLVKRIEEIQPDIIQLHNIHDHYLNYPILFKYLATRPVPVVWVQHDCWSFTGGCMYFDRVDCCRWQAACKDCPQKRSLWGDHTVRHFQLKKELLDAIPNLVFVPVSDWLHGLLSQSVQRHRPIVTIHNGVDVSRFKPVKATPVEGKFRLLGVAAVWDRRKGLEDFVRLRQLLPDDFEITLVGLSRKQVDSLPEGIHGLTRTANVEELVQLYADADVFVNPTYSDNFPTTNIEALACGTPVITYRTGGSPEAVDEKTGMVVPQGDLNALVAAIQQLREHPLSGADCRKRAEELFDKDRCFEQYIELYNKLIHSDLGKIGGGKNRLSILIPFAAESLLSERRPAA
ncbi:glycosyltransferase, group 1 family protein [gut metagenome]|uniref:Glycosyltransferase, group 1 family protein n=1 Tax=gut metagenome TaxID=749906 RepID=J9D5U9_9ZZZZ